MSIVKNNWNRMSILFKKGQKTAKEEAEIDYRIGLHNCFASGDSKAEKFMLELWEELTKKEQNEVIKAGGD